MKKKSKLTTVIIGMVFLIAAAWVIADGMMLLVPRTKTTAMVTGVNRYRVCGSGTSGNSVGVKQLYTLMFSFKDPKNTSVTATYDTKGCHLSAPYQLGDTATIYVNKNNSQDVAIKESSQFWLVGGVLACFGLAIVVTALRKTKTKLNS